MWKRGPQRAGEIKIVDEGRAAPLISKVPRAVRPAAQPHPGLNPLNSAEKFMKHLRRTALLLPFVLLLSSAPAGASLLRALVAEVPDGASLVVVSSNRKLVVVLKGVQVPRDPREAEQARQHLAALALGREVTVEYTGLRGQSIYGRVLRDGMDLGLQLVRDGAARYDGSADNTLSAGDRQLYAESERAARNERRGVWQAAEKSAAAAPSQFALPADVSVAPQSARRARPSLSTEEMAINRIAASPGRGRKPGGGAAPLAPKQQLRWPLNRPGENLDLSPYLGCGRTTLVYFYADWCPACRKTSPGMRAINLLYDDLEVIALDIREWGSHIALRSGVKFIPYLEIYDESGELFAAGNPAADWITNEVRRRNAPGYVKP